MRATRILKMTAVLLMMTCAAGAQTIDAKQVDAKTIRVTVPGKFETDFTLRKGFGTTWFDLAHDAEKKRDIAPVADENGFFWIKNGPEDSKGGSWYANPAREMELLESGPVRVRVRLKGVHMRYGKSGKQFEWPELGFELTWTVYPTGHVFGDYALIAQEPQKLHHFLAIVKSTGAWGKNGKGEGANEIHPASEAGDGVKPSGQKRASWALQHSEGPTYFTDILMVFHKDTFGGTYWNEGYQDKDYRTGLNIITMFPEATVPAGTTHIPLMFRLADDMNDVKTAALYAHDYRAPDVIEMSRGVLVKDDPGDYDKDGYNEAEGCYVIGGVPEGAAFTLHGDRVPRMRPTFKIRDWKGDAPKTLSLGGATLSAPKDFNASAANGVLLVQILRNVTTDVEIAIR